MSEAVPMIEVAFGPDGDPQFIGMAADPRGEYLYELGDEGWHLTMAATDNWHVGSAPVHPDVEEALWRGAAALTGSPDAEAITVPIVATSRLPEREGPHA